MNTNSLRPKHIGRYVKITQSNFYGGEIITGILEPTEPIYFFTFGVWRGKAMTRPYKVGNTSVGFGGTVAFLD